MKTDIQLDIITNDCEMSDLTRQQIAKDLEYSLSRFPDNKSQVKLIISKGQGETWSFDLSMRYTRGHVAIARTETSLLQAVELGMKEFKNNIRMHEFQWSIETFHFDKSGEFDYYTELSHGTLPTPNRKLSTLIVEDDPAASVVLEATLKALGCSVDHFDMPSDALNAIGTKRYDLLVLDWNLPYMKGGEFLAAADEMLRRAHLEGRPPRKVPVVICTSLPFEDIMLPPVSHFFLFNYWHKSLPFSSVLGSVDETTRKITVRNQFIA